MNMRLFVISFMFLSSYSSHAHAHGGFMIFLGRTFESIPRHGERIEPQFELVVLFDKSNLSQVEARERILDIKDRLPVFYKRISFIFSDGRFLFPSRYGIEITPDNIMPIGQPQIRQDLKLLKQAEHKRNTFAPMALPRKTNRAWLQLIWWSIGLTCFAALTAFLITRRLHHQLTRKEVVS